MITRRVSLLAVVFFLSAGAVTGQTVSAYLGSPWDWYGRQLSVAAPLERPYLSVRSLASGPWAFPDGLDHPWRSHLPASDPVAEIGPVSLEVLPVSSAGSFNSGYASGGNDGAAWQGKGFNTFSTAGVHVKAPYVSATLAPQFWAAENADFAVVPPASEVSSPYGSYTPGLDAYQRPGGNAVSHVTWGQSEVRAHWWNLTAGFGTQNLWIGPTEYNAVLLSNNAAGFPHLDIGLRKTETPIGAFEALFLFGRVRESAYFDDNAGNDDRFLSVGSVSYAPSFIPGFTLGFHRYVFSEWETIGPLDILELVDFSMGTNLGSDKRDQRLSFTLDWRFPSVGFNFYTEWALNDWFPSWRAIVRAPEHSQAFTLGGRQAIPGPGDAFFLLSGEITQLILSRDYAINLLGRGRGGFYSHGGLRQGHTERGQILGAAIGPGAAGQRVGLDYVDSWGTAGVFVDRSTANQDYLYADAEEFSGDIVKLPVEMRYGLRGSFLQSDWLVLSAETSFARTINKNFEHKNDAYNWYMLLEAVIRP